MSSIHTFSINKGNITQEIEQIPCNSFVLYKGEVCIFGDPPLSRKVRLISIETFVSYMVDWGTPVEVLPAGTEINIKVGKNPY